MKKYMPILLILAIACAFSLSVAVAADLETHDFDGKFKMDIVKGCDFDKTDEGGVVTYSDVDKIVSVIYMEDDVIKKDIDDSFFTAFKSSSGFEDDSTDGDIHIFKNDMPLYAAMVLDDGIAVVAVHKDKDTAVEMAKSIEFTK